LTVQSLSLPTKKIDEKEINTTNTKKISLSSKRNKLTNEAVLDFIDSNSKKILNNSLVTTT
jgi:hypothetical protein